jgi:hypothetical protein
MLQMNRHMLKLAVCFVIGWTASAFAQDGALVVFENAPPAVVRSLQDAGIAVVRHAECATLAVATEREVSILDEIGYPYEIIDSSVAGKTYYTIVPIGDARVEDISIDCTILKRIDTGAVVAADRASAENLAAAGFDIAKVFLRPVSPLRTSVDDSRDSSLFVSPQTDSLVQAVADAVSARVIDSYVGRLQGFVTRWAPHDSCQAAAEWIRSEFESFGLDSVYIQDFSTFYKGNVVAVKVGTTSPQERVIIGGHYDSASNNPFIAPGADDNASGTACVLQCARILSAYEFERTLVFIAFGAEEQGLIGSEYYSSLADGNGNEVVAMINVDMIGYYSSGDDEDLDIVTNEPSAWLRDRAMSVASAYVPGVSVVDGSIPYGSFSDHIPFWDNGFNAIMLFEDTDDFSPWIHTPADTIGLSYNCSRLAKNSTRVAVALLADLAGPQPVVVGVKDRAPASIELEQNVPNPFNPRTMIRYHVAVPGEPVSLRVFDVTGREVITLVDRDAGVGTKAIWWDGRDDKGRAVASGVYFYRLTQGSTRVSRKMLLVR